MKVVILVNSYQLDHSLCVIYCTLCASLIYSTTSWLVLFIFFSPPKFSGETKVIDYSEQSFRSLVLNGEPFDSMLFRYIKYTLLCNVWYKMGNRDWVCEICFCYSFIKVLVLFLIIIIRYSTQKKVFLHVDVTNLQSLAKELHISISGYSGEVPVFICFSKVWMVIVKYFRETKLLEFHNCRQSHESHRIDGLK